MQNSARAAIVVQPKYPKDPSPEVLGSLVAELERAVPDHGVSLALPSPRGHGVTPIELITIWMPWLADRAENAASIAAFVVVVTQWLRARHQTNRQRSKRIDIYGPDGRVFKSIWVERDADDVNERPGGDDDTHLPPPSQDK